MRCDVRETSADQPSQERDSGGDDRETRRLGVHEPLVQERGIAEPQLEHQTVSDLRPTTQAAQAEGMAQRNRHHLGVIGRGSYERVDVRCRARDVAVAQQHSLFAPRRTGGKQQVGRTFDGTARFEGGVRRGPLLGRRDRPRGRRRHLAGVFSQHERRSTVLERLLDALNRDVGADRYRDTAGGMNGEVGDGERDRVLAEEHDPVPGSKAEIE